MMYVIEAKDKNYGRKLADLQFVNGVARTENAWIASWFSGRCGFSVRVETSQEPVTASKEPNQMNVAELKAACEALGLTGYAGMKKEELIALLESSGGE